MENPTFTSFLYMRLTLRNLTMTSLVLTLNESEGFPGELQGVDCDCDDDDGSDDGVTHQNDVSTA